MKVIILTALLSLGHCARLDRTYLPALTSNSFRDVEVSAKNFNRSINNLRPAVNRLNPGINSDDSAVNQGDNFDGVDTRQERIQAGFEQTARILIDENVNDGESFAYVFETENGIHAEERGTGTDGVRAHGKYSYTGDDGIVYSITYTADENGFVPQGSHLPTSPPIPDEILKSLEQNAKDEAAGIFDDGSYDERKYSGSAINLNIKPDHTTAYLPPQSNKLPSRDTSDKHDEKINDQEKISAGYSPANEDNRNFKTSIDIDSSDSFEDKLPTSYDVPLQSRTQEDIDDIPTILGARYVKRASRSRGKARLQ